MSRTADYAIQGFIYQFILTLHKVLLSGDDDEIVVEGIVEDIDIVSPSGTIAIQCKYHESKQKFTLSNIYKPVLQMLKHYKNNSSANIKYVLHAHFPNETVGSKRSLSEAELKSILDSKSVDLQSLISELAGFSDFSGFAKQFIIEFGASLSDTEKAVIVCLSQEGFTTEDAVEIFYPNAVHGIAELSIEHDALKRKITKRSFLVKLRELKKTAISRWTRELQDYEKFLKKRRSQIGTILNLNSRIRAIILDAGFIKDFDRKGASLIADFILKYNSKIKLHQCPVISLVSDELGVNEIWKTLNSKKVIVERGIIAGEFDVKRFLRDPLKSYNQGIIEFKVRLCNHEHEFESICKEMLIDDIIIVSDRNLYQENFEGCNVEVINTAEINEIKYLLSLINTL